MSEGPDNRRWFQISLKTMLLVIAAVSAGLAMLRADHQLLALWLAFPVAMGLAIGDITPNLSAALSIAVIGPPFILPMLWGTIWHVFGLEPTRPDISFLGSVLGSVMSNFKCDSFEN
jgi:hypothetical protein